MALSDIVDLIRAVVWPVVTAAIIFAFRHQIRDRLASLRKAQLPGGLSFELDALERSVAETPELAKVAEPEAGLGRTGEMGSSQRYAVSRTRVDLDRALRRLDFTAGRTEDFATRNLDDLILDLRSQGEVSHAVARQCQEFFRLSALGRATDLGDDAAVSLVALGTLLASHCEYLTAVASMSKDAWGHMLLIHLDERAGPLDRDGKQSWATIATILPEVRYDQQILNDAVVRAMNDPEPRNWPRDFVAHLAHLQVPPADFERIVVFRRDELRRIIRLYDRRSWFPKDGASLEYEWPKTWGDVHFNMPVVRDLNLLEVADDLLAAEEAVRRVRRAGADASVA